MEPTIQFYFVPFRPIYAGVPFSTPIQYQQVVPKSKCDCLHSETLVNPYGTPYSNPTCQCHATGRGF